MRGDNTGTRDEFVRKGIKWHRGIWGGDKPDGTGVITVWAICTNGETEMPWDPVLRRSSLRMRVQPGDKDWPNDSEGVELIARCRRALASGRPVEVLCREGDREADISKSVYPDDRFYAARITYVGSAETGDLGTIKGDFMSRSEYETSLP